MVLKSKRKRSIHREPPLRTRPEIQHNSLERFRFVFLLLSPLRWKAILKREALKAFQCASTVKAVMENTGKAAGDGLLPCFALKSRFVQHDFSVR